MTSALVPQTVQAGAPRAAPLAADRRSRQQADTETDAGVCAHPHHVSSGCHRAGYHHPVQPHSATRASSGAVRGEFGAVSL